MRRLVYFAAAKRDLVAILAHIARASGSVAVGQSFVGELRSRCRDLAAKPGVLGRARPELGLDIRSIAHNSYVIFFRYRGELFEVVNILEGHRDIEVFFGHR